jgi:hypothetical protein
MPADHPDLDAVARGSAAARASTWPRPGPSWTATTWPGAWRSTRESGGLRAGARAVTAEQVRPPASYRLYRAIVTRHWVLDPRASPDQRTPVTP